MWGSFRCMLLVWPLVAWLVTSTEVGSLELPHHLYDLSNVSSSPSGGGVFVNFASSTCGIGRVLCHGYCMPSTGSCCEEEFYCELGRYCMTGGCCPNGQTCTSESQGCEVDGRERCGIGCMPKGKVCCTVGYCDQGETCTGDGHCRRGSGSGGSDDGGSDDSGSGGGSSGGCGSGEEECNGRCMPTGKVCCSGGSYCPSGWVCSLSGGCRPRGSVDCGNATYCPSGYKCVTNGCRPSTSSGGSDDDDDNDDGDDNSGGNGGSSQHDSATTEIAVTKGPPTASETPSLEPTTSGVATTEAFDEDITATSSEPSVASTSNLATSAESTAAAADTQGSEATSSPESFNYASTRRPGQFIHILGAILLVVWIM